MPYANKEAQREYQRFWYQQRRLKYFSGKVCVYCGDDKNLELSHIDKTKKVSHSIWSWSEQRRNKELENCEVACNSCHKKKTFVERNIKAPPHGMQAYKNGCKCFTCRKANARHRMRYK